MKKRKGISLIVLVITIIVIIILSTAILVSVVSNNPVEEANQARYESDVDSMQAVFTNTVAKVMAKNQGTVNVMPTKINSVTSGVKQTTGEVSYTVTNAVNSVNSNGTIYFAKGENTETEFYTGKELPIYAAGETKWYVDEEGIISVEVNGKEYGTIKPEIKTLVQAFKDGEIKEGDFVNYTPIKGKKLQKTLTKEDTGYDGEQNFTVEESTKWIVLGLDETGTQLLLTSASPLKTSLGLGGAEGYINGKNVLDEVCSIYKNNYAKEARSMTLEDINRAIGVTFDEETNQLYKLEDKEKKEPIEGLEGLSGEYTYKAGDYAPENYLKDIYNTNEYYQKLTKKQSNDKIKGKMYMYTIQDVVKETDDRISFLETLLLDTVINDEKEMGAIPYWLASPCVCIENEAGGFSLAGCIGNTICGGGAPLFYIDGFHMSFKIGVRPIICLNSNTTVNDIQVISETKDKIDVNELDMDVELEPEQLTCVEGKIEPLVGTFTLKDFPDVEIGTFEVREGETFGEVIERIKDFNGYRIEPHKNEDDNYYFYVYTPDGEKRKFIGVSSMSEEGHPNIRLSTQMLINGEYCFLPLPF